VPGAGQYRGAEDVRAVAAYRQRTGPTGAGSGVPPGVFNVVQGYGATAGCAGAPRMCAPCRLPAAPPPASASCRMPG
jgi:hypothetical protein